MFLVLRAAYFASSFFLHVKNVTLIGSKKIMSDKKSKTNPLNLLAQTAIVDQKCPSDVNGEPIGQNELVRVNLNSNIPVFDSLDAKSILVYKGHGIKMSWLSKYKFNFSNDKTIDGIVTARNFEFSPTSKGNSYICVVAVKTPLGAVYTLDRNVRVLLELYTD